MGSFTAGKDLALGAFAFGATKLTKNADFGKHKYSGYGIGFDARVIRYPMVVGLVKM